VSPVIMVSVFSLFVALVMYSLGAVGAFRAKAVTKKHVTYLWIGFVFDIIATAGMAIEAGGVVVTPLSGLLHTVIAFAAMFGMLAAAVAATQAVSKAQDAARAAVAKWIIWPWALWVVMFVWGFATRGPRG
jgi:hypothetical protein